MKSLNIWFYQKAFLLLFLLAFSSQAFYIPRYSPTLFELYGNKGSRTYSLQATGGRLFDNTVSVFEIGGNINPFWLFIPDDQLNFFHYFDFFINLSWEFTGNTVITDTTFASTKLFFEGNQEHFKAQLYPSTFNTAFLAKYNLFSFLDIYGGLGWHFFDDRIEYKNVIDIPDGSYTANSASISHPSNSFFFTLGTEIFIPDIPVLKLAFQVQTGSHSALFTDNYDNSINSYNSTSLHLNKPEFRGAIILALCFPSDLPDKQRIAETTFQSFASSIPANDSFPTLKELVSTRDGLNNHYRALVLTGKFAKTYQMHLTALEDLQKVMSTRIIDAADATIKKNSFQRAFRILSENYPYLHVSVQPSAESLIGVLWTSYFSLLEPDKIDSFAVVFSQSPYAHNALTLIDTMFSRQIAASNSLDARLSLFSRFASIPSCHTALFEIAKLNVESDFEALQSSNSISEYNLFISGYSLFQAPVNTYIERANHQIERLKNKQVFEDWKSTNEKSLKRISALENQTKVNEQTISKLSSSFPTYRIIGTIKDISGTVAQIWGVAIPDDGLNGYHAGAVLTNDNIIVQTIDNSGMQRGANIYEGHHCYLGKTYGSGAFGQRVPIFIFGTCGPEKTAADNQIRTLKNSNQNISSQISKLKDSIGYDVMMNKTNQ
jgi:hypothetical protein